MLMLDANGAAVRPWLTIMLDEYSRAMAGDTIFLGANGTEASQEMGHGPVPPQFELLCHGLAFWESRLLR